MVRVSAGYRMRILCLKVGRSGTQGKGFATLWITTPEPQLSATHALESLLCKNTFQINLLTHVFCILFHNFKQCQKWLLPGAWRAAASCSCIFIFKESRWNYDHMQHIAHWIRSVSHWCSVLLLLHSGALIIFCPNVCLKHPGQTLKNINAFTIHIGSLSTASVK